MPYCPTCFRPVEWIPQYGQYWCHACQRYHSTARESVNYIFDSFGSAIAQPPCNWCGAPLEFIQAYQRWYCHRCQQYK